MRGVQKKRQIGLAFAGLTILFAATAQATPQTLQELAREGRLHFDAGEYAKAVSSYIQAYQLEPAAAVLYNIAFIYDRKLGETKLAMNYLRRYVESEDADPAIVERALKRLRELKNQLEVQATATAQSTTGPPLAASPTTTAPEEASSTPAAVDPPQSAPAAAQPAIGTTTKQVSPASRAWLWTGIGGVGLFTAGAILGGLSKASANKFSSSRVLQDKKQLRKTARSTALAADVLMGTGLLTAIIGTSMTLFGGGSSVAISAQPVSGGTMVWWQGSF